MAIRPFTVSRKNWVVMNSTNGAKASAFIYSIAETARANNLNVQKYLEYLLTELSAHADDTKRDFIADLLPWSKAAKKKCRSSRRS